jgi:hypothetical protein
MVYTGGSSNSIFLIDRFVITDTKVHSYRTDPSNILLAGLGDQRPPLQAYAIWLHNAENTAFTATAIGNITGDGVYPDYMIPIGTASSVTVNPNDTQLLTYEFNRYPTEYISVQVQFSTAPTKGYITAKLLLYVR